MAKTKGNPRRRPTFSPVSKGSVKSDSNAKPARYLTDGLKGEDPYTSVQDSEMFLVDKERIATHIRNGKDRGALMVVTHGDKLTEMTIDNLYVQSIIDHSGLAPLIDLSYEDIDKGMLSAFVERWEYRTSSFHLPHGEMTITLDDVASLLHIPVTGTFFALPAMPDAVAQACLMGLLGVSHQDACREFKKTEGQFVRLSWLRVRYQECLRTEEWEFAARAYLLHLVGSTLFADKSSALISVQYLELFRDLTSIQNYAWGAAALAYLYNQLDEASYIKAEAMAGYATLLQAWVYEHFPTIVNREEFVHYTEAMPRAHRWIPHGTISKVLSIRRFLDRLSSDDICWAPYDDHRGHCAFENISFYSGYIRCGDIVAAYLPERVLRQFGHVQGVPPPHQHVTNKPRMIEDVDQMWEECGKHMIKDIIHLGDCSKEYLRWFLRVSNPFLTPSVLSTNEPRGRQVIDIDRSEPVRTPSSSTPVRTSGPLIPFAIQHDDDDDDDDDISPNANELGYMPNIETDGREFPDSLFGDFLKMIAEHAKKILKADNLSRVRVLAREALDMVNSEAEQYPDKKRRKTNGKIHVGEGSI